MRRPVRLLARTMDPSSVTRLQVLAGSRLPALSPLDPDHLLGLSVDDQPGARLDSSSESDLSPCHDVRCYQPGERLLQSVTKHHSAGRHRLLPGAVTAGTGGDAPR